MMQYLITHFSDFQLACLGSFFLHESIFFFSGLPFIFLERAGWLSKYKIQVQLFSCAIILEVVNYFFLLQAELVINLYSYQASD
jgi:4-alpha-methyl-delta7-sterol-4alpha-methyl oxidase